MGYIDDIVIRTYIPEDIDYIIKRHREIYDEEYGFGPEFAYYVEKYVREFDGNHDVERENIWIAEMNGRPVGMIALVRVDETTAMLRWFLIEPEMRGKGLGHKLMEIFMGFCNEKNYKHVFLWTVDKLEAARHLYKSYGFQLTETKVNNTWGSHIIEERWDLNL